MWAIGLLSVKNSIVDWSAISPSRCAEAVIMDEMGRCGKC